jgi:hypothetical protein
MATTTELIGDVRHDVPSSAGTRSRPRGRRVGSGLPNQSHISVSARRNTHRGQLFRIYRARSSAGARRTKTRKRFNDKTQTVKHPNSDTETKATENDENAKAFTDK